MSLNVCVFSLKCERFLLDLGGSVGKLRTNLHLDFPPQPIFRVMGFSVMGRVLNSQEGEGVPDATVTLNNHIKGER